MRARDCIGFFLMALVGCGGEAGPELIPVTGTVTLNGQPLAGANVRFQPVTVDFVRVPRGVTSAEGIYELQYDAEQFGAEAGSYTVLISVPDANENETLPEKYNARTELTAEVAPGQAPIDFALSK